MKQRVLPGLLLAAAVTAIAVWLSGLLGRFALHLQGIPDGKSPISAMMVAILLGIALANTVGLSPRFLPGLKFCVKRVLRLGIILVGIKLSFFDVLALGAFGVPVVAVIILSALVFAVWLARRIGVSDRLGLLAAASTSICGVTAAVSLAPAIDARDSETAYTVANVTIFGLLAMFLYPYFAHWIFDGGSGAAGLFLGTAIHDTSQVMGAALSYKEIFRDELAMKAAVTTKLTRNVFLVAVVPFLAYLHARRNGAVLEPGHKVHLGSLFPTFVLGFLAMAVARSVGDAGLARPDGFAFGIWDAAAWKGITGFLGGDAAYLFLATAMGAVGLSTDFNALRGLGWRPVLLGGISALFVGAVSLALSLLLGGWIA